MLEDAIAPDVPQPWAVAGGPNPVSDLSTLGDGVGVAAAWEWQVQRGADKRMVTVVVLTGDLSQPPDAGRLIVEAMLRVDKPPFTIVLSG